MEIEKEDKRDIIIFYAVSVILFAGTLVIGVISPLKIDVMIVFATGSVLFTVLGSTLGILVVLTEKQPGTKPLQ